MLFPTDESGMKQRPNILALAPLFCLPVLSVYTVELFAAKLEMKACPQKRTHKSTWTWTPTKLFLSGFDILYLMACSQRLKYQSSILRVWSAFLGDQSIDSF